jgi:hypothetical protein
MKKDIRTARKNHLCDYCEEEIKVGERYTDIKTRSPVIVECVKNRDGFEYESEMQTGIEYIARKACCRCTPILEGVDNGNS